MRLESFAKPIYSESERQRAVVQNAHKCHDKEIAGTQPLIYAEEKRRVNNASILSRSGHT
jgi:hypothetical protein